MHTFNDASPIANGAWLVPGDLAIKSAVILVAAWVAVVVMRRASAATRHLVWALAVCATLTLPVLCGLLPKWRVLPAWIGEEPATFVSVAGLETKPVQPVVSAVPSGANAAMSQVIAQPPITATVPDSESDNVSDARSVPLPARSEPPVAAAKNAAAQSPTRTLRRWQMWVAIGWGAGSVVLLLPIFISIVGLWRMGRRLPRIEGGSWTRLARELACEMKLKRPVTLLRGRPKAMPMTWGFLRPKLVLPPEAEGWSAERRRVVVMHELAHIKRGDFVCQFIVQLARALYWINPLMWVASRQIALESEGACDDLVLAGQTKASDYAEHLLAIATGLKEGFFLKIAAVAMARQSRLESRLVGILDGKRNRARLTLVRASILGLLLSAIIIPVAALRAGTGSKDSPTPQTTPPAKPNEKAAPATLPAGNPSTVITARDGQVVMESGGKMLVADRIEISAHADVIKAKLEQARAELNRNEQLSQAGAIDQQTLRTSKSKVEMLEAELAGDSKKVAQVRLAAARRTLEVTTHLFETGAIAVVDLETAKGDVAVAEAQLREEVARAEAHKSAASGFLKQLAAGLQVLARERLPDSEFELSADGIVHVRWRTQQYDVHRPTGKAGKDPGEVRREMGPSANGLILTAWVTDELGQAERPQTLDNDGKWKTYLGQRFVPSLQTFVFFNLDYGPQTDAELQKVFGSPESWLAAAEPVGAPAAAHKPEADAREQFLAIERIARLPAAEQSRELDRLYHELAPPYMNWMVEGILSSAPTNILDHDAHNAFDGNTKVWARQLADAAAKLTPEQVADKLKTRMWLAIAARARAMQVLAAHLKETEALIQEDLRTGRMNSVQRAGNVIQSLKLTSFSDQLLKLVLAGGEAAEAASFALIFAPDPAIVKPLLAAVEKDPKVLIRWAGLFQGPLQGHEAEPALVKLLDSTDADIRFAAAYALYECVDPALAAPTAKLAHDADARMNEAALNLAMKLPDAAFKSVRDALLPLLHSRTPAVEMLAIKCFAQRKDLAAGPVIWAKLQLDTIDGGDAVTVMQALNALAGSSLGYDLHHWGPAHNQKAIRSFETILRNQGVEVGEKAAGRGGEPAIAAEALRDLTKLKGRWKIQSIEGDGSFRMNQTKVGDSVDIERVSLQPGHSSTVLHDHYEIAPLKSPKELRVDFWGGDLVLNQLGIYELTGDKLTICFAPYDVARPTKFVAENGKSTLIVFTRDASYTALHHPIDISGNVVDDATGKPISNFSIQGGRADDVDPTKITWGYTLETTTSGNPKGLFHSTIDWAAGWRSRIVASGYVSEPILTKLDNEDAAAVTDIVIRLKRGRQVSGHVFDFTGKPVKDAGVYVVGNPTINLTGGRAMELAGGFVEDTKAIRVATNAEGAFTVTGIGDEMQRIAITCSAMDLWVVPVPKGDAAIDDLEIRLPQPGKLVVHYDIPGAPDKTRLLMQLHTWDMPEWAGVSNDRYDPIQRGTDFVLDNLAPGVYTIDRSKSNGLKNRWDNTLLDRRTVKVESGKAVVSDFVRPTGAPIVGQVVGLDQGDIAKAKPVRVYVRVLPPDAGQWPQLIFDSLGMEPGDKPMDGKFTTERIPPGKYKVRAEVFIPETEAQQYSTGIVPPAFVGETLVTVPEEGQPEAVKIELAPFKYR